MIVCLPLRILCRSSELWSQDMSLHTEKLEAYSVRSLLDWREGVLQVWVGCSSCFPS